MKKFIGAFFLFTLFSLQSMEKKVDEQKFHYVNFGSKLLYVLVSRLYLSKIVSQIESPFDRNIAQGFCNGITLELSTNKFPALEIGTQTFSSLHAFHEINKRDLYIMDNDLQHYLELTPENTVTCKIIGYIMGLLAGKYSTKCLASALQLSRDKLSEWLSTSETETINID